MIKGINWNIETVGYIVSYGMVALMLMLLFYYSFKK